MKKENAIYLATNDARIHGTPLAVVNNPNCGDDDTFEYAPPHMVQFLMPRGKIVGYVKRDGTYADVTPQPTIAVAIASL